MFSDVYKRQRLVKVFEENLSQMISFADDNRILAAQIAETGKRRSEHRDVYKRQALAEGTLI